MDKFRQYLKNFVEGADEVASALISLVPAIIIICIFIWFLRGCIF